jgi:hypothetical protein
MCAALGAFLGWLAAESVWGWIYFQVLVTDDRYCELRNAVVVAGAIAGAATGIALALLESWLAVLTVPIHFLGCTFAASILAMAVGYQALRFGGSWWLVVLGVFFGWQALIVMAALRRLVAAAPRTAVDRWCDLEDESLPHSRKRPVTPRPRKNQTTTPTWPRSLSAGSDRKRKARQINAATRPVINTGVATPRLEPLTSSQLNGPRAVNAASSMR